MDNGLFKLQESGVSMGLQIRRTRRYKRRAIANKQTKNEHNDQFANYK
jgi:hypothetical protein